MTLFNGGHEQDVKAMLELYDNPEELTFPDEDNLFGPDKVSENNQNVRKDIGLSEKWSINVNLAVKLFNNCPENGDLSEKLSLKWPYNANISDKMAVKKYLCGKMNMINGQKMSDTAAKLTDILILALEIEYITINDVEKKLSTSQDTRGQVTVSLQNPLIVLVMKDEERLVHALNELADAQKYKNPSNALQVYVEED